MNEKIFISYSRKDKDFALQLAKDLRSDGIEIWMDQLDIPPGRRWDNAIEEALDECKHFMVILSNYSVKSDDVRDEIAYALDEGKRIIPVLNEDCKIPLRIRRLNYIDFTTDYNLGRNTLIKTLLGEKTVQSKKNQVRPSAIRKTGKTTVVNKISAEKMYNQACNTQDNTLKIKYYTEAIELNPEYEDAYYNRGNVYDDIGQFEQAISDFTQIIEINPNYGAEVFNNRGFVYNKIGEYNKAISDYNQALKLNSKYAIAFYNRGLAKFNLLKYEEAIKDYSQTIRLDPNYAFAYYNRASAYDKLSQYNEAIIDYSEAIRLNPKDPDSFNNRGLTYFKLSQYKEAISDFSEAINLNADYTLAYYNRGLAKYYSNLDKEAVIDYTKAISLYPEYTNAYFNRGVAYQNINNGKAAIADYNKYLELGGANEDDAEQVRQWIRDLGDQPKY